MRISDWSSDVCSSDLSRAEQAPHIIELRERITHSAIILGSRRRRKSPVLFRVADRCRRPPDQVCRLSDWESGLTTIIRPRAARRIAKRSEAHTSELQSLMRTSYAVFCLQKKNKQQRRRQHQTNF